MEDLNKKQRGQFYTTNASYILTGLSIPQNVKTIIEPFAGQGDLIGWVEQSCSQAAMVAYDIQPKHPTNRFV
jgi:hypothetical protein